MIDGPTLRELRRMAGVSLRKVAEAGNLNHTHLAKVERAEPGRPVTPTILLAYERGCGVDLTGGQVGEGLQPGQLTEGLLRRFAGRVGAVAAGGIPEGLAEGNWADLGQLHKFLVARSVLRAPLDQVALSGLAQVTDLLAGLDGVVAGQIAGQLLPWVVRLQDGADDKLGDGLLVVIAYMAARAARAAVQLDEHEVARSLYLVALYHARRADEPDLAARVLAGIAEQHVGLEHYRDAVSTCRLGEVDDRITDTTRQLLAGIRSRAVEGQRRVDERVQAAVAELDQ